MVDVVRPVRVKSRLELRDCGGGDDVSRKRIPIVHNSVAEGVLASWLIKDGPSFLMKITL